MNMWNPSSFVVLLQTIYTPLYKLIELNAHVLPYGTHVQRLGIEGTMDLITDDIIMSSVLDQFRNSKDCKLHNQSRHEKAAFIFTLNCGPTMACRE